MTYDAADPDRNETINNLRYAMRFGVMQRTLFARLRALFSTLQFLSGTAAFATVVAHHPELTASAGLVMAVVTALDVVIGPADKANEVEIQRCAVARLFAESDALDTPTLVRRWRGLLEAKAPEISSLREPALRAALREQGYPVPTQRMSFMSRMMAALV